jgi:hypothetical protein
LFASPWPAVSVRYDNLMSRGIFRTTLLTTVLICRAADPEDASLRQAWLQASNSQGATWDRTALLKRMVAGRDMVGTPRAKVLDMFGSPGYSEESYPGGSKMDFYRLSAANEGKLRLDYDSGNVVTSYLIDAIPCSCDSCAASAPLLTTEALNKSGLIRATRQEKTLTMSEFEKLAGRAGKLSRSRSTAGGRAWLNYTETWRVGAAPYQFLMVDGHVPSSSAPTQEVGDKPVLSWALVSFAPGCLAK